jgi:hypothetical protein
VSDQTCQNDLSCSRGHQHVNYFFIELVHNCLRYIRACEIQEILWNKTSYKSCYIFFSIICILFCVSNIRENKKSFQNTLNKKWTTTNYFNLYYYYYTIFIKRLSNKTITLSAVITFVRYDLNNLHQVRSK